jgi:hypothetical protein
VVETELCPQDGYEIFAKVLGNDFGADALRLLPDSQVKALGLVARKWLECETICDTHLQQVIHRTLHRCSADG